METAAIQGARGDAVNGGSTITREELAALLRCPRCHGSLAFRDDLLECGACSLSFATKPGNLPIYDLFIDEQTDQVGRDPRMAWSRLAFERGYEFTGYHESNVEFDRKLGYPAEVSNFLFERVKKRLLSWVSPGANHRVLDVGCGAGYFLNMIRDRYRQEGHDPVVVGVDISAHQVSYMAERMSKEGVTRVVAATGNGEFLPFADETFDLVTCSEVLEHIRNPKNALMEMRRVLKPGGLILLSTPSMSAQKGWSWILLPASALVKFVTRYKNTRESPDGYEIPWYAKDFRETILSADIRIQNFEYNAIIPHPYHFIFLWKPLVRPTVAFFAMVDRTMKWALKPLALHFVVRASRLLVVAILGLGLVAAPLSTAVAPRYAYAEDDWLNRNYFQRGTDEFTADLLANVERNHFAQENFWKAYHSGDLKQALDNLKYVLLVFPNHPRALHLMTIICKTMQDSTTPIVYFEKAIRLFPTEAYTQAQYGAYLLATGEREAASSRLKEALRLNPNLTYALGLMAELQKQTKVTAPAGKAPDNATPPAPLAGTPAKPGTPSTSSPSTTVR